MEQQVKEPQSMRSHHWRDSEGRDVFCAFQELFCDGNHNVFQINILGEKEKTNQQTTENFISFALKVQNKTCTEIEKIVENKLSREQMPTIHHSRDKEWCQKASMTNRRAGRQL